MMKKLLLVFSPLFFNVLLVHATLEQEVTNTFEQQIKQIDDLLKSITTSKQAQEAIKKSAQQTQQKKSTTSRPMSRPTSRPTYRPPAYRPSPPPRMSRPTTPFGSPFGRPMGPSFPTYGPTPGEFGQPPIKVKKHKKSDEEKKDKDTSSSKSGPKKQSTPPSSDGEKKDKSVGYATKQEEDKETKRLTEAKNKLGAVSEILTQAQDPKSNVEMLLPRLATALEGFETVYDKLSDDSKTKIKPTHSGVKNKLPGLLPKIFRVATLIAAKKDTSQKDALRKSFSSVMSKVSGYVTPDALDKAARNFITQQLALITPNKPDTDIKTPQDRLTAIQAALDEVSSFSGPHLGGALKTILTETQKTHTAMGSLTTTGPALTKDIKDYLTKLKKTADAAIPPPMSPAKTSFVPAAKKASKP